MIELIELEGPGSILDRINKAEKKGLISDSQKYIEIRQLRNSIAHEYDSEALMKIFEDCLTFTPDLLASVESISDYIKLNNLL